MEVGGSAPLPCHHEMVVGEITRSCQLVEKLRSIVLPPRGGEASRWPELQLVGDLFDEVLQSYRVSVSMLLHPCSCLNAGEPAVHTGSEWSRAADEAKSGEERPERTRKINYATDSRKELVQKSGATPTLMHSNGHQWLKPGKRNTTNVDIARGETNSWTTITEAPHFDGHQWRKYGEKHISKSQFPKTYYKCSSFKEQGCLATKTIQQKDGSHDPASYVVKYNFHHTCKPIKSNYSQHAENTSQQGSLLDLFPNNTASTITSPRRKPSDQCSSSSASSMLIDLNLTIQFRG
ncbi:putative WRKY transcription factor 46 [Apostasia shenzhenica]|uniref:Putative WRKY transcription factor 46 n=1 Tax=Apostasia shenzhenica TaxID=1088818 RepID=A0A2I0A4T6_9ASPA|nr:putative WRKY transcription factor 46 [Apostasia shenzhenica]